VDDVARVPSGIRELSMINMGEEALKATTYLGGPSVLPSSMLVEGVSTYRGSTDWD
jgi:hypothetical protein